MSLYINLPIDLCLLKSTSTRSAGAVDYVDFTSAGKIPVSTSILDMSQKTSDGEVQRLELPGMWCIS